MQKRVLLILLIVFFLLIAGTYFYFSKQQRGKQVSQITSYEECIAKGNPVLESYPPQCKTDDGKTFAQDIGNELEMMNTIVIENPRPMQKISSPLVIKGRARGTYFFEATFPVKLLDSTGKTLAEGHVEAQEEWMTEEFVPFVGELTFKTSESQGTLLLMKSNPSGLSKNDQTLKVPVMFIKEK